MNDELKVLNAKLELFWVATGIPVRFYDSRMILISEYILASQLPILEQGFLEAYDAFSLNSQELSFYTNKIQEHFLFIKFHYNEELFSVICGPTIDQQYDNPFISQMFQGEILSYERIRGYRKYFDALPKYSLLNLCKMQPLLTHLLTGEFVELSSMLGSQTICEVFDEKTTAVYDSMSYHHTGRKTELIIDSILNADRDKLLELLIRPDDGPFGVLCIDNPIRSYKNLFISTVTDVTTALIKEGIDSESTYTLSDTNIQMLEELTQYDEITKLFLEMFHGFIDLVEKSDHRKYTRPVYLTIEYIHKHASEKIIVHDLAKGVHLSESHLLKLFKSQTGLSVKDYILKARIERAKKLLRYRDDSIAAITSLTGFSDQSHFTKTFKAVTGLTPKIYRESIYHRV